MRETLKKRERSRRVDVRKLLVGRRRRCDEDGGGVRRASDGDSPT